MEFVYEKARNITICFLKKTIGIDNSKYTGKKQQGGMKSRPLSKNIHEII